MLATEIENVIIDDSLNDLQENEVLVEISEVDFVYNDEKITEKPVEKDLSDNLVKLEQLDGLSNGNNVLHCTRQSDNIISSKSCEKENCANQSENNSPNNENTITNREQCEEFIVKKRKPDILETTEFLDTFIYNSINNYSSPTRSSNNDICEKQSPSPGKSRYGRTRKPKVSNDFVNVDKRASSVLNSASYDFNSFSDYECDVRLIKCTHKGKRGRKKRRNLSLSYDSENKRIKLSDDQFLDFDNGIDFRERAWELGDLAWAKMGNHPFWPCVISIDPESSLYEKFVERGKRVSRMLHVNFIKDNGRHTWVVAGNLMTFKSKQQFLDCREASRSNKIKLKNFHVKVSTQHYWNAAVEEAEVLLTFSTDERIKLYTDNLEMLELYRPSSVSPSIFRNTKLQKRYRNSYLLPKPVKPPPPVEFNDSHPPTAVTDKGLRFIPRRNSLNLTANDSIRLAEEALEENGNRSNVSPAITTTPSFQKAVKVLRVKSVHRGRYRRSNEETDNNDPKTNVRESRNMRQNLSSGVRRGRPPTIKLHRTQHGKGAINNDSGRNRNIDSNNHVVSDSFKKRIPKRMLKGNSMMKNGLRGRNASSLAEQPVSNKIVGISNDFMEYRSPVLNDEPLTEEQSKQKTHRRRSLEEENDKLYSDDRNDPPRSDTAISLIENNDNRRTNENEEIGFDRRYGSVENENSVISSNTVKDSNREKNMNDGSNNDKDEEEEEDIKNRTKALLENLLDLAKSYKQPPIIFRKIRSKQKRNNIRTSSRSAVRASAVNGSSISPKKIVTRHRTKILITTLNTAAKKHPTRSLIRNRQKCATDHSNSFIKAAPTKAPLRYNSKTRNKVSAKSLLQRKKRNAAGNKNGGSSGAEQHRSTQHLKQHGSIKNRSINRRRIGLVKTKLKKSAAKHRKSSASQKYEDGYRIFSSKISKRMAKRHPELSRAGVDGLIRKKWLNLSSSQKYRYSRVSKEEENDSDSEDDSVFERKKRKTTETAEHLEPDESLSSTISGNLTTSKQRKSGFLFAGLKAEKVCQLCEKPGDTLHCQGLCGRYYHFSCAQNYDLNKFKEKHSSPRKRTHKRKIIKPARYLTNDEDDPRPWRSSSIGKEFDELRNSRSSSVSDQCELTDQLKDGDETSERLNCYLNDYAVKNDVNGTKCDQDDKMSFAMDLVNSLKNSENDDNLIADCDDPSSEGGFRCKICVNSRIPPCFICGYEMDPKTDSYERIRCHIGSCAKIYHKECLKDWPQTTWTSGKVRTSINSKEKSINSTVLLCPQHNCHTCISDNPAVLKMRTNNDRLVRCIRCPTSYHRKLHCIPAGSELLTAHQIICPRHYEPPNRSKSYHFNTSWCFICAIGGSLICCDLCPTSFHADCLNLKKEEYEGSYICEDCQTGRFPLYGEIVWVKLGHYRWWPARILFPAEIPENILNLPHRTGEFVVFFFGSKDYYWVNRGRVFLYQEGDSGKPSYRRSAVDVTFNRALGEAQEAFTRLKMEKSAREEESKNDLKPPRYVKIKTNKPVGNVRIVEPNPANITACDCNPNSNNPCGPDSDCINRMLMVECNPSVCKSGKRCNNQYFEKRLYPPLMPYRTENRGWGLKTLVPIKKGDFVIEYVGEMIDEEEYKKRLNRMHRSREDNYYFLTIDKDRMLDAGPKGNVSRFMNHSCDPNCETQKWTVNGDTRVGLFALKDIPANTELVFNYNLDSDGAEKKPCNCGSGICSGFIGVKVNKKQQQQQLTAGKKLISEKSRARKKHRRQTKLKRQIRRYRDSKCFVCNQEGKDLILCKYSTCPRAYHSQCVTTKTNYSQATWLCPSHFCAICKSKRKISKCSQCANSYCQQHVKDNITFNSVTGNLCKRHSTPTTSATVKVITAKAKKDKIKVRRSIKKRSKVISKIIRPKRIVANSSVQQIKKKLIAGNVPKKQARRSGRPKRLNGSSKQMAKQDPENLEKKSSHSSVSGAPKLTTPFAPPKKVSLKLKKNNLPAVRKLKRKPSIDSGLTESDASIDLDIDHIAPRHFSGNIKTYSNKNRRLSEAGNSPLRPLPNFDLNDGAGVNINVIDANSDAIKNVSSNLILSADRIDTKVIDTNADCSDGTVNELQNSDTIIYKNIVSVTEVHVVNPDSVTADGLSSSGNADNSANKKYFIPESMNLQNVTKQLVSLSDDTNSSKSSENITDVDNCNGDAEQTNSNPNDDVIIKKSSDQELVVDFPYNKLNDLNDMREQNGEKLLKAANKVSAAILLRNKLANYNRNKSGIANFSFSRMTKFKEKLSRSLNSEYSSSTGSLFASSYNENSRPSDRYSYPSTGASNYLSRSSSSNNNNNGNKRTNHEVLSPIGKRDINSKKIENSYLLLAINKQKMLSFLAKNNDINRNVTANMDAGTNNSNANSNNANTLL